MACVACSGDSGPFVMRLSAVEPTPIPLPRLGPFSVQHGDIQGGSQPQLLPDANFVPGFPQDAFMEGPMMAMDRMVEKPETYGLRPGWSGFMQGMMTFLRVLPPDMYDKIMSMRQQQQKEPIPAMEHQNPGA